MVNVTRSAIGLSNAVAKEIRIALIRRDMRQTELADMLGVSEMWVSRRLRGAQPIDLNDLERFAIALRVPVTDLLPRPKGDQPDRPVGITRRSAGDDQTLVSGKLPKQRQPTDGTPHPNLVANLRRPAMNRPTLARQLSRMAHHTDNHRGVDAV